jgi:hypothetical protein
LIIAHSKELRLRDMIRLLRKVAPRRVAPRGISPSHPCNAVSDDAGEQQAQPWTQCMLVVVFVPPEDAENCLYHVPQASDLKFERLAETPV